ncbi:hypothetical protein MRX96_014124 [Rhipicephalus microplus]
MSDFEEYRQMIMNFRVSELQVLLGFAGRNKSGKKQELQLRALDLLRASHMTSILVKIRELHKRRFPSSTAGTSSHAAVDTADPRLCAATPSSGLKGPASYMPSSAATRASSLMAGHHGVGGGAGPPPLHSGDYSSKLHHIAPPPPPLMGPGGAAVGLGAHSYPVHPDVRFKKLPFYDILAELHRPASLMPNNNTRFQENSFVFHFTPQQVNDINSSSYPLGPKQEFSVQVQLRFCLLETSCEQDDNYPPSMCVKVNSKVCPLPNPIPTNKPGMEPKRPSRPINIAPLCRLSPHPVQPHIGHLAFRVWPGLCPGAMIKEKLQHDPDSEIATTSLRGSLICPLGKMRMGIPLCDRPATFSSLVIDGLFMEISMKAPSDCTEVQFHEDGSWSPLVPKKETHVISSPSSSAMASTSRSSAPSSSSREPQGRPNKKPRVVVIDLTACSSDEDDDGRSSVPTPGSHLGAPPPLVSGMASGPATGPPLGPSPSSSVAPTVPHSASTTGASSSMHYSTPPLGPLGSASSSSSRLLPSSGHGSTASHESSSSGLPPSTLASSSLYPGMPVMDAGTPPYYPPVSSPYQEYFSPAHPMYHYNFDLYSLLNNDSERSIPSYSTGLAHKGRTTPDIISLD